ncbi:LuxR C-terminal-related transcriptional regulator [Paenibacillus sp. J2TS4]|uniref:protein kinase domain-containing protein n=1 Tax=Paenibacillus sp. J2TS4 TaxID=2807194 RepID=UPI001B0182FC|nr:LuxR C-terminal-related transcriptional regulator [Paenibacillus sp. J2TS4]GIP33351.1 hypothetical protein J2TS4_25610 [Paenibacillus sp. J2TS4]
MSLSNYQIYQLLYEDRQKKICRAYRIPDHQPVILKIGKAGYSTSDVASYVGEFEIMRSLRASSIFKPYELNREDCCYYIVFEGAEGTPLSTYMEGRRMSLSSFLRLAARLTEGVSQIHQEHVLHGNLQPDHIFVEESTLEFRLFDFSCAVLLDGEHSFYSRPSWNSLPYLAPETAGRLNRPLDFRADLYSLGVLFYEMLTGQLPFLASNRLDWIHAHLAVTPVAPHRLVPALPLDISEMVMRLLAKNAEDRYETASKLQVDLEKFRARIQQDKAMAWTLGSEGHDAVPLSFRKAREFLPAVPASKFKRKEIIYEPDSEESRDLDLSVILRAYDSIANITNIQELLKQLMTLVVKQAGAQKGCLLLVDDDGIGAVAERREEGEVILHKVPLPIAKFCWISPAIVEEVAKTREAVCLGDASREGDYVNDSIISESEARSILCLPIALQGDHAGILYLSNEAVSDVFRREGQQVLRVLAAQVVQINRIFRSRISGKQPPRDVLAHVVDPLTHRETEVLNLIALGLSDKEIAFQLRISPGTVKYHVRNIYGKLGVKRRTMAVAVAQKMNLLTSE